MIEGDYAKVYPIFTVAREHQCNFLETTFLSRYAQKQVIFYIVSIIAKPILNILFFTFTFRTESMVIGPKTQKFFFAFLHVSWPSDSEKPPKKEFFWHFFVRTYVCRALNHLTSRDPQMLEPWFWCQNISIYGALMLLKLFQNWPGVLELSPFFNFLKFWKVSVFWDYLEKPLRYTNWCTREQKSFHSWQENFWCSFFWPPVFNNGGVRENLSFSIMLNYLVTPLRYINTCGEKKLLLMTIKLLLDFVLTPWQ